MSALGIQIVSTAALHPAGRGAIERFVQTVKVLMKKLVATRPTYYYNLLTAKVIVHTIAYFWHETECAYIYKKRRGPCFIKTTVKKKTIA